MALVDFKVCSARKQKGKRFDPEVSTETEKGGRLNPEVLSKREDVGGRREKDSTLRSRPRERE